jgi:hypothetical protein
MQKKKQKDSSAAPKPLKQHENHTPAEPYETPEKNENDPDIIAEDDEFETQAYEKPEPGEGP